MDDFKRELFELARLKLKRPGSGDAKATGFTQVFSDAYADALLQALAKAQYEKT
jgi:hypothetical protein